ncbi:MAG: DEAD/DEAH box helicase, partial [Bradyrhizobium guangdongense]
LIGIAQTGTGKTAGFVLPMIDILHEGRSRARMPRSLILEPTRELAAQVSENFEKYGKNVELSMALLIGGESFSDQERKLDRGVDVLIATPGRLIDLFERGKILMNDVKTLVIDEADRMLDMGFIPDIERICKLVPFTRQTLFFTATMPPEIRRITETFLHNPQKVEVSKPATTAVTVTQCQVPAGREAHEKRELLRRLLREAKDLQNAIIFCNRKRDVAVVHKSLQKHGFSVGALHGDMDQSARTAALEQFRKGELPLLVASDVAARGLDIPEVSHVFNFDVPHHPDDYVHRVGRTGRAGRSGMAISLVTPLDQKSMVAIEKLIGQTIPRAEGDYEIRSDGSESSERPREGRGGRERSRGGRGKSPRGHDRERSHEARERTHEPRSQEAREQSREQPRERSQPRERNHEPREQRSHEPRPTSDSRKRSRPQAETSNGPSIGRPEPRRAQRPADAEPGDHSHLPAFLLRPVRTPAGA